MWLLIDGNSWYASDFHGSGVDAPRNFVNRVKDVETKFKFTRVVIAFDGKPSFRHSIYSEYKAGRDEKPVGFDSIYQVLRNTLRRFEFEVVEIKGLEADDVIASYVEEARLIGGTKCVICSADKDMFQLLQDGSVSQIIKVTRDDHSGLMINTMTAKRLFEEYGVTPDQWIEYRMLVGDSSDNIPGCVGIGPDAATKVLSRCGTLERFWESPLTANLGPKKTSMIIEFKKSASLYRRLVTLVKNLEVPEILEESATN